MAKLLKLRRGTTSQHNTFTGAEGEVTIDTTKDTAVVHDGSQAGGRPLAREDMSNVSSASIAGRLGAGAIQGTQLENSGVTAGAYGSSSAIPIVTVDAQGLVTAASTTAIDSTTIANGSASVAVSNNGPITSNANHDFSAGIDVTGNITATGDLTVTGGDIHIQGTEAKLHLTDTNNDDDFLVFNNNGTFKVYDATNNADRFQIDSNGGVTIGGNTDFGLGIDVTGDITTTGDIDINSTHPRIDLNDTGANPDWSIINNDGVLGLYDQTNGAYRFNVNTDGHVDVAGNLDVGAGVDVTGNITVTGTVDGVNIGGQNTLMRSVVDSTGVIASGVTGTTPSTSDNTTKVATTAFVRSAISTYGFPSGTLMLFAQTSAPTGWTKSTTHNNKALRVVSGSASSGGTNAFTTAFGARGINANASNTTQGGNVSVSVANSTQGGNVSVASTTAGGNLSIGSTSTSGTVNSHTLSVNEMPSHQHGMTFVAARNQARYAGGPGIQGVSYVNQQNNARQNFGSTNVAVNATGGNGGHSHGFSGGSHNHNGSLSGTAHNHNATFSGSAHNHNATGSFSGSAHNHSISVGNLDMAVQYVDVIIASKD